MRFYLGGALDTSLELTAPAVTNPGTWFFGAHGRVEAPEALLSGQQDLGMVRQPGECVDPITEGHPAPTTTLKAGDLLILHANLLHGVRPWDADVLAGRPAPRLARARFVEKMGASSAKAFAVGAASRISAARR